jgi:hypothetical protein
MNVIAQFPVTTSARYLPANGVTWCNIYAWDVSRALGCEIPHWWQGREQTANNLVDWLSSVGPDYGWAECNEDQALDNANNGLPTFVTYKNQGGHGHIAVVLPGGSLTIAQAGLSNFVGKPLTSGFGNLPVQFFSHP